MTGKLLSYHLKSTRVPLVVRVPQFENHWSRTWVPNMQPTHGLHVAHDVFWEIIDELL